MLVLLLVLLLLGLADLAQGQVVLQPLVLVLVVHEVSQQPPVTRSVVTSLDHEVVSFVAEIRHRRQANNCILNVGQLLEAQRVRRDSNLRVLNPQDALLIRANKLNSLAIGCQSDEFTVLLLVKLLRLLVILNYSG